MSSSPKSLVLSPWLRLSSGPGGRGTQHTHHPTTKRAHKAQQGAPRPSVGRRGTKKLKRVQWTHNRHHHGNQDRAVSMETRTGPSPWPVRPRRRLAVLVLRVERVVFPPSTPPAPGALVRGPGLVPVLVAVVTVLVMLAAAAAAAALVPVL